MNKLRRTCALVILSLTLTVSALAGTIHSTGVVAEPPPPPPPSSTSTSTSSITTTVILTLINLIR